MKQTAVEWSEIKNELNNVIGTWKLKSVKYSYIYSIVSKIKFQNSSSVFNRYKEYHLISISLSLTLSINKILQKQKLEIANKKKYLIVLNYIKSEYVNRGYVKIPEVLKHFSSIDNIIDRQVILDMVNIKLLSKSYHKIYITKKGFEYMKEK